MLHRLAFGFYKLLLVLAGIAMIGAFASIMLNILARIFAWNIPGLDGYAGYSIAAALFLALPSTLRHNEHIRATLFLDHVSEGNRKRMETLALLVGTGIALYLAWFSARLVWVSYTLHDVAPTGDATPMWIPQLSMALGALGFAVAFLQALWCRFSGQPFHLERTEASHAD